MRPKWLPGAQVIDLGEDGVQVRLGSSAVHLRGAAARMARRVGPVLDGRRGLVRLAREHGMEPHELRGLVELLGGYGLLFDSSDPAQLEASESDTGQLLAALYAGPVSIEAVHRYRRRRVLVVGEGRLARAVKEALILTGLSPENRQQLIPSDAGLHEGTNGRESSCGTGAGGADPCGADFAATGAEAAPHWDLILVAAEGWAVTPFDQADALLGSSGPPWLRVAVEGSQLCIGPLFIPGGTACFRCFAGRLLANAAPNRREPKVWEALRREPRSGEVGAHQVAAPAVFCHWAAAMAAAEVFRFLTGAASPLTVGAEIVVQAATSETAIHPVLRSPVCERCGPVAAVPVPPVQEAAS